MRHGPWLLIASMVVGCGGARLLPTTLFHAPLASAAEPSSADWIRLANAGAQDPVDALALACQVSADEWVTWTTRQSGESALVIARRTSLGLEAQALGAHVGPAIRPTLRVLVVGPTRVIVLESSSAATSTERDAWLYVVHRGRVVPLGIDEGRTALHVRAERRTTLDGGWCRVATFTATLEASGDGLVVHEHASVRELAEDRPELAARSTSEVERARTLRWSAGALRSDRASLFTETN